MKKLATATLALCSLSLLAGCSGEDATPKPQAAAPAAATLPVALFTDMAPAKATSLVDAKSGANPGDRITFEARVGGRVDPFIENRAVFFVADPSLVSCDEMEMGDEGCKTPWDYCCEPPESLLKHMATVRVVDDEGQPLKVAIENEHGLAGLANVVVVGTVEQATEDGNFVVNAESIHVKAG